MPTSVLGYGNTDDVSVPAAAGDVPIGGTVDQVAAGYDHSCAVLTGGATRCWGLGAFGQLGYGNVDNIGDDETPASAGDVDVGAAVSS
jgi:alpha-tubulin suppressor-like RCC1 family protein